MTAPTVAANRSPNRSNTVPLNDPTGASPKPAYPKRSKSVGKSNRLALMLCNDWALLFDANQWILANARNVHSGRQWQPISYIASTKSTLRRVLMEKRIYPELAAEQAIDSWPERFLDWLAEHKAKQMGDRP